MVRNSFLAAFIFLQAIAQGHPGVGILEDSKGNVFYTDLEQVWKIAPNGTKTIAVPNVHTHELYMDEQDNLFGEHLWYNGEQRNTWGHYVWRMSPGGKIEKVIPDKEGFLENYSFVRDHAGRMYWADRTDKCQKVVRKNADNSTTPMSNACFDNIRNMKSTPDGTLYLVDFQDIKRIDPQGNLSTIATEIADKKMTKSSIANQNSVMGIWADSQGNIYTAISSQRLVKKFGPDGKEEIIFQTSFPWSPSGGMIDAKGNLWVLEYSIINAVRVEKIDATKKKTVY